MAGFRLKVSIDELKRKADDITRQIDQIEKNWNRMCSIVERSKAYWEGEAGEDYRKLVRENKQDVDRIIRRLREHLSDLLQMAGVYTQAENIAIQLAKQLPNNVIK